MGSPEAMLRATVNRLGARLGHGLADVAAELAVLAQDAPERIRQEWQMFQDEVMAEAQRLQRGEAESDQPTSTPPPSSEPPRQETAQMLIDRLRASVADLSRDLEARS